jgi:molybdopterin converting factor small subunit
VKVTVVCFGAMRAHLPAEATGNRAEVELAAGDRVSDLIDKLGAPRRLVFALLVDGTQADIHSVLSDGAEVTLMPPFSGGGEAKSPPGAGITAAIGSARFPRQVGGSDG